MPNNKNQNQRVVYSEGANSLKVISEILKNNKIEEKLEKIVIIDKITKDFVLEKILSSELIPSLQKQLEISKEIAEKLAQDIKTRLVPLTEKNADKETETDEMEPIPNIYDDSDTFPKIKPPIGVKNALNEREVIQENAKVKKSLEKSAFAKDFSSVKTTVKQVGGAGEAKEELKIPADTKPKIKKLIEEILPETTPKKSKGSDSYREPIE